MKTTRLLVSIALLLTTMTAAAQDSLHSVPPTADKLLAAQQVSAAGRTHIDYDLSTEMAVGTGDYTAYQLVTNRHHVLATRPNTAYMRGAFRVSHDLSRRLTLTGAVDMIASMHADHKVYLQQCYANLSYGPFYIEAGSRETPLIVRNNKLGIGSFVLGNNAKPIPQVRFGTNGFWNLPLTKGWVQANFGFGYGKPMDNGYRESLGQSRHQKYATGAYYHQKHLYFRTNPEKRFFVMVGIEHVAQFGGTRYEYANGRWTSKSKPSNLKAFWNVILPLGDSKYLENESMEDWVWGNHVGVMTYEVGWNITRHHQVQLYLDNPFEDGSGVRKGNGWDGTWGIEYKNSKAGRQWLRGAVFEYFQSTNQGGPLHFDRGDYQEPIRSQITDVVTGKDNYYNHTFYVSYDHFGMTPGIALITSPKYNANGELSFLDNRVKAWHLGFNGELTDRWSYLVKGSYREGWGSYDQPLAEKHHSFDALLQGQYAVGPWHFQGAFAFDVGNIYGNCSTFNIKINYHGKIL